MLSNAPVKLGFIPARRGIFNAVLAARMRSATIAAMQKVGVEVIVPSLEQTQHGCVENPKEAQVCGELFRHERVHGIVINAVNFGDEQAVAQTLRHSGLNVPVLIVGCQEEAVLSLQSERRDSFCGLLSIGEALRQVGVRYSVGSRPICFPSDPSFAHDLAWFAGVCRVIHGVRTARYAQIGVRPDPFWTCRYDEKTLQQLGPTVMTLELTDLIAALTQMSDSDADLRYGAAQLQAQADTSRLTDLTLLKLAKLELFLDRFAKEHGINAFAIQCWTAIQRHYGISTCTAMSRLTDRGIPCACEADILGALSMHACQMASQGPAALADWNNLHNEDDELANLWHCGVQPPSFAKGKVTVNSHHILATAGIVPEEDAMGVSESVARPGPVTLARITQDDNRWKAVIAQGDIEDNPAQTFGAYGWCRIEHLQRLYRDVLLAHFPHHVALTQQHVGNVLWEALGKYLGMSVYHATQDTPGLYTSRLPFTSSDVAAAMARIGAHQP